MRKYLILLESPALRGSLRQLLLLRGVTEEQIGIRTVTATPHPSFVQEQFDTIANWIEQILAADLDAGVLPDVVALTDFGAYGTANTHKWMNPLEGNGWGPVLGLLVLAFPEIHWILYGRITPGPELQLSGEEPLAWDGAGHFAKDERSLEMSLTSHSDGYVSLFDPSGLRSAVRYGLNLSRPAKSRAGGGEPDSASGLNLPLRWRDVAAIDDESGYAFVHAYAAYRFGYRAHVVTTYGMLHRLFGPGSTRSFAFVFEDLFLNFPDHHPEQFSNLKVRDSADHCPKLATVPERIFITIGQSQEYRKDNQQQLAELRMKGQRNVVRYKPLAGIFNLWESAGLMRRTRYGYAENFHWPPQRRNPRASDSGLHSAPGRLLRVADRLIRRAGVLRNTARDPVSAVYGAMLALEAVELLGDRTPTTGIEALSLKHQFEVLAECQFSGVEYHLPIRARLEEIGRDCMDMSSCFKRRRRLAASLNGQMQITNSLISVLGDHGQFDEEQVCRAKARSLHNSLWMRQNPVRVVLWPVLRYCELLLADLSIFFWAVLGWVIAFTGVFALLRRLANTTPLPDAAPLDAFGQTISSFFGAEPFTSGNVLWQISTVGAVLIGIGHVSILSAHIYSILARK